MITPKQRCILGNPCFFVSVESSVFAHQERALSRHEFSLKKDQIRQWKRTFHLDSGARGYLLSWSTSRDSLDHCSLKTFWLFEFVSSRNKVVRYRTSGHPFPINFLVCIRQRLQAPRCTV